LPVVSLVYAVSALALHPRKAGVAQPFGEDALTLSTRESPPPGERRERLAEKLYGITR